MSSHITIRVPRDLDGSDMSTPIGELAIGIESQWEGAMHIVKVYSQADRKIKLRVCEEQVAHGQLGEKDRMLEVI